jgi:acetylornithine/succinyldiaminopimelate/putrescine aminotransferase
LPPELTQTQSILERHDRYMVVNLPRYPIAMVRGEGCTLYDAEGKSYLDLFAGFGGPILGHCHPDLVDAVTEQARTLWHAGNLFHTEPQTRLAQHIHDLGFGGRSFFCHSGADANEAAIKLARLYGKANPGQNPGPHGQRIKIISTSHSFHGRSFATMPATGNPKVREGFGPLAPGFVNVAYNDLAAVEAQIDGSAVAVLVEPIQGEGGINVPDPSYFAKLRALCDQHDLLLIADEVWTGCGRTGRYFGYQHWLGETSGGSGGFGGAPDIMTLGKGVGGGLAVGVMCAGPRCADLYDVRKQGLVKHATTLGGNCLSMAVAARVFEVIERDRLVDHAATLGEHAVARLTRFAANCNRVKCARGKGLFIGVELDLAHCAPRFASLADVVKAAMAQGLLINGTQTNVIRLAPPLTITRAQLDQGLDLLEGILAS